MRVSRTVSQTLLMSGDLTRAPSFSLKATFRANWMARPVMVPVDRGSILVTALMSPALVRCVFRDTCRGSLQRISHRSECVR